jgi:deazaflavin-dependent oxidoreductase (nitroreductase family)
MPLSPLVRKALHAPVALYHLGAGPLFGHRFLLLTHRGRTSGRTYETMLEVVEWRPQRGEAVVLAGLGRRAQWLRNVQAGGAVEVRIARRRIHQPATRILDRDEAAAALAGYERRNRIAAPIVRRVLSRLAGFDYDGSDAARRRLVDTLPLVGFSA